MPRRIFFVGVILGLSGVILLYIVAAKLYEVAVARRSPAVVQPVPPPSDLAGEAKSRTSGNHGTDTQVGRSRAKAAVTKRDEPQEKVER